MDELLEIIGRIGGDDAPTDEELAQAREQLVELLRVATAADTRDLEAAKAIREAVDTIDTEISAREVARAEEEETARRLLEGLEPAEEETSTEETEEAEANAETREPEPEPEPVAASTRRPNLASALRRASARITNDTPGGNQYVRLLSLGAAQSEILPQNAGIGDVARLFDRAAGRVKNRGDRQALVRLEFDYPENRRLTSSQRDDNDRILDTVLEPAAIAAAGGICDPLPADFTHPVIGDRGRPIRDGLPRFQGVRGGVRYSPAVTLGDLPMGSVGVWTHETDQDPGSEVKDCGELECEEELTAYVDAVTACLKVGNFQARFNPEFWRSRLSLLMVMHDRMAEQKLYADMVAAATAYTTYGAGSGTIYSVLSAVDKTVAGIRSRLRYRGVIRTVAPEWVRQALRADIASQRLGSSPAEALTVADNVINSFFTSRGVSPIWSLDLDPFAAQTAGTDQSPVPLNDFPGGNVDLLVYTEGAYFFLDGGTLDLGTEVVDQELIRQNNRLAFMETFERAAFRGGESIRVTVPVDELCLCPDVDMLGS